MKKKSGVKKEEGVALPAIQKVVEEAVAASHHRLVLAVETKIDNLAILTSKHFTLLDKKIDEVNQRIILLKTELAGKLDGLHRRYDDLAFNRATRDEVAFISKRIDALTPSAKTRK